jgi:hypothetical protein
MLFLDLDLEEALKGFRLSSMTFSFNLGTQITPWDFGCIGVSLVF